MTKIRLTKEFSFEMAHALENYDGKCRHIHGHSYIFKITIIGNSLCDKTSPKFGMVVDFGEIKKIVINNIIGKLDHALVVRSDSKIIDMLEKNYGNVVVVDYQPTCENLIADFAKTLIPLLPGNVKLHHLKLHETRTSYAEWYAEDN